MLAIKRKLPGLLLFLLLASSLSGQERIAFFGRITDADNGEGLPFATVYLVDQEIGSAADVNGYFRLPGLSPGRYTVRFQMMSYQAEERVVDLAAGKDTELNIVLRPATLALGDVTIVAQENKNSMSSSSVIGSQAVEHVQASSLGDVLQLMPGQAAGNSDLTSSSQVNLRGSSATNADDRISAMGTAIVVDGAPLSNDANLQVTNTSTIGAAGYFETVSGGGVDLRRIPADNIESVEVIKGIPSVKHGDMTSGVVIVNTRRGEMPVTTKVKFNATSAVAYLGKGFRLGEKGGVLNADFDYAFAQADLRVPVPSYTRATGKLAWSNSLFGNFWNLKGSLDLFRTFDTDKDDKDALSDEKRFSEEKGIRFTTSGKMNFNRNWITNIDYNVSINLEDQVSYTRMLNSGTVKFLSTALTDTTMEVPYIPAEYLSATYIKGKPFNFYSELNYNLVRSTGPLQHKILAGAEWKITANYGEGRYFEEGYYPPSSTRPRSFSDIPPVNTLSAYIEDLVVMTLFKRELKVQAGLRFENTQPLSLLRGEFGQALLPRFNLNYKISGSLKIRGGYGLSAKSPSLVYLYPDKAYMDVVSYQYYSNTYPDENLAIMTTRVFEQQSTDLQMSVMKKWEAGFDYEHGRNSLNITFYSEKLENGYSFKDVLAVIPYPSYNVYFYIPGFGMQPMLDTINVDTLVARDTYKIPQNNRSYTRRGVEFTYNSPKLPLTGTSLNVTGAWMVNQSYDNSNQIYINSQYFSGNTDRLIGIYPSNGYETQNFLTTFRLIQHIPSIRFLASFAVQVSWFEQEKTLLFEEFPVAYVDRQGTVVALTEEEAQSAAYDFLVWEQDELSYMVVQKPALWNINFRVTKEITDKFKFSFYANNMFMHHPAFGNIRSGNLEKRNPELSFGGEINFSF
ncbi:MAG: TonB-dependent receptor [Bacteroidota bacterium]